jgi:hypothetical protein
MISDRSVRDTSGMLLSTFEDKTNITPTDL